MKEKIFSQGKQMKLQIAEKGEKKKHFITNYSVLLFNSHQSFHRAMAKGAHGCYYYSAFKRVSIHS